MNKFGLYTLANDGVYDQVIALVNSIERNISPMIPICIIPFDQRIQRLQRALGDRAQVSFFDNQASLQRWDRFAREVWAAHPRSQTVNFRQMPKWYNQCQLLRKMSAFDGEFEQFVFYDADSLAMSGLDRVWQQLKTHEFVFDDWEHKKPEASVALKLATVQAGTGWDETKVRSHIHCSSFFGGHRDCFSPKVLRDLQTRLVTQQEVGWVNDHAFWCDADLFSYMTLRLDASVYNFALSPNPQDRTGNTAEARYINREMVLYNEEGMKPIHRLHYITHSADRFRRLCQGEATGLPQQDIFLFYRFLHEPERAPQILRSPNWLQMQQRSLGARVKRLQQLVA